MAAYDESLKESDVKKTDKVFLKEAFETVINYPEAFQRSMPGEAEAMKFKEENRGREHMFDLFLFLPYDTEHATRLPAVIGTGSSNIIKN